MIHCPTCGQWRPLSTACPCTLGAGPRRTSIADGTPTGVDSTPAADVPTTRPVQEGPGGPSWTQRAAQRYAELCVEWYQIRTGGTATKAEREQHLRKVDEAWRVLGPPVAAREPWTSRWLEPQPDPVRSPASVSVTDAALAMAPHPLVRELLVARREQGRARYSTELMSHCGRVARCDLLQELVDAYLYSVQEVIEAAGIAGCEDDADEWHGLVREALEVLVETMARDERVGR